jgi:mono/diheme cytochrome c family protein
MSPGLPGVVWGGMQLEAIHMRHRSAHVFAISIAALIGTILPFADDALAGGSATLERGRYLVKTTGCNDCHTAGYLPNAGRVEEARWLTGDRLGWQGPWGTTYPPNLRLLAQGLTPEQWLVVARRPARPPMPWFALRDMTDADVLSIYHFIRSLGPAGEAAPAFAPPGQPVRTPVVKVPG